MVRRKQNGKYALGNKWHKTWLIFTCLSLWASVILCRAEELDTLATLDGKLRFLSYLRKHQPNIYADFIVNFDPILFLGRGAAAAQSVSFSPEVIKGHKIVVSDFQDAADMGEAALTESLESFQAELEIFDHYGRPDYYLNQALMAAIDSEIKLASRLGGLNAVIAKSPDISEGRLLLKLPPSERVQALSAKISQLSRISNFIPRLVGLDQDFISGDAFVRLYRDSLEAQERLHRLFWLFAIADSKGKTDQTVGNLVQEAQHLDKHEFLSIFNSPRFDFFNNADLQNAFRKSFEALREFVPLQKQKHRRPLITVETAHPVTAWTRGSLGDCSTFNSFTLSMAHEEEVDWLSPRRQGVRGYSQFTRVQIEGATPGGRESAIYVHTISGAGITQIDTLHALYGLFQKMKTLGISHFVIPAPSQILNTINYPEIAAVFTELTKRGKPIRIFYSDGADRVALAAFTNGSIDLPQANELGYEIQVEDLGLRSLKNLDFQIAPTQIETSALFPKPSYEDALLVALDLRNRNTDISQLFSEYKIDAQGFEALWNAIQNQQKLPIREFHDSIEEKIAKLGGALHLGEIQKSPLLFRGHFAAPDALKEGPNLDLALRYIGIFLNSFTDLPYFYENIAPNIATLQQQPAFVKLIRSLFRRNLKEMQRRLDFYELEHRSAYQTLIKLFRAGLSTNLFETELTQLEQPPSVRKIIFLGFARGFQARQFDELLTYFETLLKSDPETVQASVTSEDIELAGFFFAEFIKLGLPSKIQSERLEKFLHNSDLGVRFIGYIGQRVPEKIDMAKFVQTLLKNEKYYWAGRMISKPPWSDHPLAASWLAELWKHRQELTDDLFLQGFLLNPAWLKLPGSQNIVDTILKTARDSASTEAFMMRVLVSHSETLTPERRVWLAHMSSPALTQAVAEALTSADCNSSLDPSKPQKQ